MQHAVPFNFLVDAVVVDAQHAAGDTGRSTAVAVHVACHTAVL